MKDLTSTLFKVSSEIFAPVAGRFIIAEPFLREPFFTHSVVSIIDYLPEEGATGVVLNNATEYHLADLLEGVRPESNVPVFCGGPTGQDRLFFIHTLGPDIITDARPYGDGIYVGGSFDDVVEYVNDGYQTEGTIRFFLGHSNWADGQLEREIEHGKWVCMPDCASFADVVKGRGDSSWHNAVRQLGEDYRSWQLLPRNAACN